MTDVFQESTETLYRPHQVDQAKLDIQRLESTLNAPPHIASAIQDKGEMVRQLRSLKRDLESQAPKPYTDNLDDAIAREALLREEIRQGMPTDREMRRNMAGATDKHRKWEARTKEKMSEWKNIRLNLHAGGHLDELPDATDIANFEKYRPDDASHELNMHNEQIVRPTQYGPAPGAGPMTVFSSEETSALKTIDPEIASQLVVMNNDQRASVKAFMQNVMTPTEETSKGGWTPERRAAASAAAKERFAARKLEG